MNNTAYLENEQYLNKYLEGKLCREERQFAAMLFSIFLEEKRKKNGTVHSIVKKCLNLQDITAPVKIKEVYFETTLMRDFFENDREDFNRKLLKYCLRGLENDENNALIERLMNDLKVTLKGKRSKGRKESRHLGQSETRKLIKEKYPIHETIKKEIETGNPSEEYIKKLKERICLDIAGMMMNATPDLLIEYTVGNSPNTKHVKALECKYLSKEGTYKDVAGVKYKMQFFIQNCIMQFCFGDSKKDVILPSFPSKSIWGKNKELWYSTYNEVYKKISAKGWKPSNDLSNEGIEIIQFIDKKDNIKNAIPICLDELIIYSNEKGTRSD